MSHVRQKFDNQKFPGDPKFYRIIFQSVNCIPEDCRSSGCPVLGENLSGCALVKNTDNKRNAHFCVH